MTTRKMANFIRQMVRSLGERIPDHWTDKQVLQFAQYLIEGRK
jgi:hypothetical protein